MMVATKGKCKHQDSSSTDIIINDEAKKIDSLKLLHGLKEKGTFLKTNFNC